MLQLSISEIRQLSGVLTDNLIYTTDKGQEGVWQYDPTDLSSIDNTGTILVTADSKRIKRIYSNGVSIKWFGAIGDFNPSNGLGADDRLAIQAAFDYACSLPGGCNIIIPEGRYYLGSGYYNSDLAVQLILGSITTANAANDIVIDAKGSEIYGNQGRNILIANANRIRVNDLKVIGFTGGPETLGSFRENNALLCINYNSNNVIVDNAYLTNGLGDCILLGGALDIAGGGLGFSVSNIKIVNSTLKERIGNNIASYLGGTRSREAIAMIDCLNIEISSNSIYGSIDLEPNLSGQYVANVNIQNNLLLQGNVTPQSIIGTNYWYDEPIAVTGGALIDNDIKLQGVAGAPLVFNNVVDNNNIENGTILGSIIYKWDKISNNVFQKGEIRLGFDSGIGSMSNCLILNNIANDLFTGSNAFIRLIGQVANCIFSNNVLFKSDKYCLAIENPITGPPFDQGNVFINNLSLNGSNQYIGSLNAGSIVTTDYNAVKHILGSISVRDQISIGSDPKAYNNFEIYRAGSVGHNFSNTSPNTGSVLQLQSASTAASNWLFIDAYAALVNTFRVYGNGDVVNRNNSYGALSDIKLKNNITSSRGYLEDLLKINIVKYNLKDAELHSPSQLGVIAQEVEKIFPGLVDSIDDIDIEGNNLGTKTKTVKYSIFIPMLIKAIQELNEKISAITSDITEHLPGKQKDPNL